MRQLVLWNGKALLDNTGALILFANDATIEADLRLYLGRTLEPAALGAPIVAVIVSDDVARTLAPVDAQELAPPLTATPEATPEVTPEATPGVTPESGPNDPEFSGATWGDLRALGATFSDRDAGLFTAALALANWHDSHRYSPRTGMATVAGQGGWVRTDIDDGREVFPRTDPAIIVGIVDADDRILLGHNALWPANRYSLLAGFVEPGESLESAAVREVFEESGIRIVDPVYLGSQPWPFPASLMLGFMARVDPNVESTLTPDGAEILDLRWFSREELAASLDQIGLPGHTSIARAIIEHWYGGPILDRRQW